MIDIKKEVRMRINKEFLKSLEPCDNRYNNYLEHHSDFDGSFSDFLDLDGIHYEDKLWVTKKILNKNQAVNWSILCADSVVHVFEHECPNDNSVSNCINYLKTFEDFDTLTIDERLEIEKHVDANNKHFRAFPRTTDYIYTARDASRAATYYAAYSAASYAYTNPAFDTASYTIVSNTSYTTKQNQKALNLQFLKQVTSV